MNSWTLPRKGIRENFPHSRVVIKRLQMRSVVKLPSQVVKSSRLIPMTTTTTTIQRLHRSHGQIFSICASNLRLDACNMVIHSFHSTYYHNFVYFVLNYDEKNYLTLDRPL
ncbi:hypothetical protein F4604DRAFT_1613895 [Suillus subluteus]|nr:hypothetical protein F4604DRAFT_1613895 [Suillus subluteus]